MIRRVLGSLLFAVAALAAVAPPAGARAAQDAPTTTKETAPVTPDGQPAIDDLVGCVEGSRHLLVLLLIDESASLQNTDPSAQRVDAARAALGSLSGLAAAGSSAPKVDVAMAAFSNKYRTVRDWTPLRATTEPGLLHALEGFASRNHGIDTDFVTALTSARQALTERAATVTEDGARAPCRAVLLFTDGGYDIAVRKGAQLQRLGRTKPYAPGIALTNEANVRKAEAAGRRALCRPGGLADGLRADEVTLLTLALSGELSANSQKPLAAATAGRADDYVCGTPRERTPGAYLPASNQDLLLSRFDEVATRLGGGTLLPPERPKPGEEPGNTEVRPQQEFDLDPTVAAVHLFALAPEPGAGLKISGPAGEETITEPGTEDVGSVKVTSRGLAGRGFVSDMRRPADAKAWTGPWTATVVDANGDPVEGARINVYVATDLKVQITNPARLRRGETADIEVTVTAPKGVDPAAAVAKASASLRIDDPLNRKSTTVALQGPPTGPFTGRYEVPKDLRVNAVDFTATVRATTSSGASLSSQATRDSVPVDRPVGSVQIQPAELSLPSVTTTASTSTDLILVGGDAEGCVWFGSPQLSAPEGAEPVEFTVDGEVLPVKEDCLEVPAKSRRVVTLRAEPAGKAIGSVHGSLTVFEQVKGKPQSLTQVAVRFDIAGGVDQTRRLVAAGLLLLVGLAGPMLLLLLINTASARFQDLDAVVGTVLPITVQGRQISRIDGGRRVGFYLSERDFVPIADSGSTRSFTFGGIRFRTKASRNPFGGVVAMAAPEGGAEKLKGGEGSRVELDPGLSGSWILLVDADATVAAQDKRVEGTLIAFAAAENTGSQVAKMVLDIENRLPGTADSLAKLVRATPVKQKKAKPEASSQPDDDASDGEGEATDTTTADHGSAETPSSAEPEAADAGGSGESAPDETVQAPLGFTGAAAAAPPAASAANGDGAKAGEAEEPDDEPPPPPVGFGGVRPSSS